MNMELYHPYVNDKGDWVRGNASLLHYISECGGLQAYHDEIGKAYLNAFVREHSDIINAGLAEKARRSRLKVS